MELDDVFIRREINPKGICANIHEIAFRHPMLELTQNQKESK